jgi:5-methyltetrahydropteroyltriglutamate--homocysteine methyltransferase
MSFAVEKLSEIVTIVKAVESGPDPVKDDLEANKAAFESRKTSKLIHDDAVQTEMKAVTSDMMKRKNPFATRAKAQQDKYVHPLRSMYFGT